ncbi:MAG: LytR family transcriptional regulator [Cyanobacteria bacterium SIG30]|nr:LytR family transcriptional regulator [Cyanobacteria bacterium SIG30]
MNKLLDRNRNIQRRMPIRHKNTSATESFLKSFTLTLSLIFLVIFILYLPDFKNAFVDVMRYMSGKNTARFEIKMPFSSKRQNILILGADISENKEDPFKGVRSDSIAIVSIAPYAKDVNIISIPRDSKVYISGENRPDKINHAFSKGGITSSVSTIEETFGIRINHYIVFSTKAIVEFIDAIGGLPIYVEKNMSYHDSTAKLHIDLKKGEHVLTGKDVEGYVRFRKDALGDIGRIKRQQHFVNALVEKVKEPATLIALPDAIKKASEYIKTDMSIYQIIQTASLVKTLDKTKIHTVSMPGAPSSKDEISYWILDPEKTQQIIDRLVYRDKPKPIDRPLNTGVLFHSSNMEQAQNLNAIFEKSGFDTRIIERDTLSKSQISIHNLDVTLEFINEIKKQLPELQELPVVYDLIGLNRAGKDFSILLAK